MTPEALTSLFDSNAVIIMFVWGLVHTRWSFLAKVPNAFVPWVNAIGYVLAKFAVPDAHAGILSELVGVSTTVAIAARGMLTSALTSWLYDKFGAPVLDRYWPKAR